MADPISPPQPLPATPEALAKVLERKPVLWIGAGLSVAAGYPSTRQLVEAMASEADDPLDTSQPFFAVADAFVASVGKGQLAELMARFYRAPRAPTAAHRALARLAGAGRFHAIVTSNADRLIERALDEQRVPYLLQPRDDFAPITGEGSLRILPIEGSHDDWLRVVLSGRAHADLGRRYPFLEGQLHELLRRRPLLFVGSSLQDPRLLDWIAALSEEEAEALMPWRALIPRSDWDAVLAHRYDDGGGAERAARDALACAHLRPLLLESHAELPRLLADVADAVAPPLSVGLGMKLRELTLRDFRGFEDLRLALPDEPLAVLVGVNGAGKSSVLDAIALLLAYFTASASDESFATGQVPIFEKELRENLRVIDVREGANQASVGAIVEMDGDAQQWKLTMERVVLLSMRGSGESLQRVPGILRQGIEGMTASGIDARRIQERLKDESAGVPVICYYPADRTLSRDPPPRWIHHHRFRQLHAYDRAFDHGLGPFQDFVQWFRSEEDRENEARARGDGTTSPPLDAVRAAVERFMNALPGGRFANLRAERRVGEMAFSAPEQTSLVLDKAGQRIALEQLSDGERALLLLVADIARRLAIANPALPDPLRGSGIVLIDEIELHLHPGWQRAVLPGLRRAFPGLQIVAATHSPQVLSQVPSQSVILLDGFQVAGAAPPTYGRDSNAILEEVMSVPARPEEAAARLKEVARLIDEGRLEEARAAVDQVASWLGTSDSEVVRLGTLIEFLRG